MKRAILAAVLASGVAACGGNEEVRDEAIAREVQRSVAEAESRARESRTLSALAKLEEAIAAYVSAERQIPKSLDDLVPKYLAEIPSLDLEVRGHAENNKVRAYSADVLRDGQIDGSRLRDSGRWGYVYNDRQVVVFIDCTHRSTRGHPWYQAKGVF